MSGRPHALKLRAPTLNKSGRRMVFTARSKENFHRFFGDYKGAIVRNEEILVADSGLYTWIIKGDNIIAVQVKSSQELGTLHNNLDLYTPELGKVELAGEFVYIKEDAFALFNFLSGTYMKGRRVSEKEITRVKRLFGEYEINSDYYSCVDCSEEERVGGRKLIERALILTGNNTMGLYRDYFNEKEFLGDFNPEVNVETILGEAKEFRNKENEPASKRRRLEGGRRKTKKRR
jgi:hypothetical protein